MDDLGGLQVAGPATFARSLREEGGIGLGDYIVNRLWLMHDNTFLGAASNRGQFDPGATIGDTGGSAYEDDRDTPINADTFRQLQEGGVIGKGIKHVEGMTQRQAEMQTEAAHDRQWAEYVTDVSQYGARSYIGLGTEILSMPFLDPVGTAALGSGFGASMGRAVLGRFMADIGVVLPSMIGDIALQDGYVAANHLLVHAARKAELTDVEKASDGLAGQLLFATAFGMFGGGMHGRSARRAIGEAVDAIGAAEAAAMRGLPQDKAVAAAFSARVLTLMGIDDSAVLRDLKHFPGMAEAVEAANAEKGAIRSRAREIAGMGQDSLDDRLNALRGSQEASVAFGEERRMLEYEAERRIERDAFMQRRTEGKAWTAEDYDYLARSARDEMWLEDKTFFMEHQEPPKASVEPALVREGEKIMAGDFEATPHQPQESASTQGAAPSAELGKREADLHARMWDMESEAELAKIEGRALLPEQEAELANIRKELRALDRERQQLRETNIAESAVLDYTDDMRAAEVMADLVDRRVC